LATYISMLRGINVSGRNKINMSELKSLYEAMKFKNVTTYIQSGNVVFDYSVTDTLKLSKMITKKILNQFEFDIPVLTKKFTDFDKIIRNNPFLAETKIKGNVRAIESIDKNQLYVTFLSEKPTKHCLEKIESGNSGKDKYKLIGTELFLYVPKGGYGKTKLSNIFFEKKLNLTATTRNWKTINKLHEIGSSST